MNTRTRILFVDDEPLVLDGLRRILRPMRGVWDIDYVESGAAALEQLGRTPADIIVSDIRMPGMSGAELLDAVSVSYPQVIRVVLSGHADERSMMETVTCTHQFLAKPCSAEVLKATIERACIIRERISDQRVNEIASRFDRLPSFPSNYDELVGKMRDPESSIEEIAAIVSRDPAMSAGILKIVNSAYFGFGRRVVDMVEAINFIGLEALRSLVLSVHIFRQFDGQSLQGLSLDTLRDHSLHTAMGSRAIAKQAGSDGSFSSEAFIAGMLHDIGSLAIAENHPDLYAAAVEQAERDGVPLWKAEKEAIGFDHAEVGSVLLALNGLPDELVSSTAWHHQPFESGITGFSLLTCVHLANAWAHERRDQISAGNEVDRDYIEANGFEDRLDSWKEALYES